MTTPASPLHGSRSTLEVEEVPAPRTPGSPVDLPVLRLVGFAAILMVLTAVLIIVGRQLTTPDGAEFVPAVDGSTTDWIVGWRSGAVTSTAKGISFVGGLFGIVVLAAVAGVWLWLRTHRLLIAALPLITVAITEVVVRVLKHVVDRPRPGEALRAVHATGAAFPSGHAAASAALAAVVVALAWRFEPPGRWRSWLAVVAVAGAVLIAASRVVLGVHWMSDVFAGALVGVVVAVGVMYVTRPAEEGSLASG